MTKPLNKEHMEINIKSWIERFDKGEFDSPSRLTQCQAGWYDWFCEDSSLAAKTKALGEKLKQIADSKKINKEKQYVWFKNNCAMCGPLYDDFRIADIESGDIVYTIVPRSGHTGKAEVWGRENDFKCPLVKGTWRDVVKFFNAE